MKTTTTPRAAKPARTKALPSSTARVSIKTAERIAHLADAYDLPSPLIAGSLAEMGLCMADFPEGAERVGRNYLGLLRNIVQQTFPTPRCTVPCLVSLHAMDSALGWVKNLNRPMEIWLGQMIEIGLPYIDREAAVFLVAVDPATAIFHAAAHKIQKDNDTPEAAELLKPAPKAPPAFIAFEQILASRGVADEQEGGAQ